MSKISLKPNANGVGTFTIEAPSSDISKSLVLPDSSGTILTREENINLGVSVAASGTAIDFVEIPEGVKRVTVMFDGVSTNGTSHKLCRIGSGVVQASDYVATSAVLEHNAQVLTTQYGRGFGITSSSSADLLSGTLTLNKINNTWLASHQFSDSDTNKVWNGSGKKVLDGPLDRIRITPANETDQFDAGTINISWEF